MKSGKALLGILVSFAAGALAGIVFAPQKGAKTRRKIMNKSEDYLDDIKDKFDELLTAATRKIEKTWHETEELVSKEKDKYSDIKKEVKNGTL